MTKIFNFFIAVLFSVYSSAQTNSESLKESLMTLDEIPSWVLSNIQFPQEAYEYGIAGIEQVCISASWDGKVFITSMLNTLNPAFEKEIVDVISKAPRCRYNGSQPKDIYKYMLIDFHQYIPEDKREQIQQVTMHIPPRLSNIPTSPFNSRDKFVQWIHNNIQIPSTLKCYSDTLLFQYTITKKGKVNNISILQCKNDIVKCAIEDLLKKSPKWEPAIADRTDPIDVTICDKIIIKTDNNGILLPLMVYRDDVFCNTRSKITDPDMIVFNPEIKAKYNEEGNFLKNIMRDVSVDKKVVLNGSFIIEKDGTTSHIEILNSSDVKIDSIVKKAIVRTKWIAAVQGETPVRTLYSFGINKQPRKQKQSRKYSYYDIFGKYFIALHADPMRISYRFIQGDGTIQNYPFNSQGLFDYKAYYQGMLYYYKNSAKKNSNISKNILINFTKCTLNIKKNNLCKR